MVTNDLCSTIWRDIKDFVNSHEKFTRKDLYKNGFYTTGENYILLMKHVGFINKVGIAKYERIIKIPESLSSTKLYNLVKNKSEGLKYMRKYKLENIKNLYKL